RWAQVRQIFDAAIERQPPEWPAFVRQACGADDELRKEVQALLISYSKSDDFLSRPAVDWSRTMITGEDIVEDYPVGYRVGPYRLHNCLGRGGMGSVYAAARADSEFDQKTAIKFVRRGMDTTEILRRFRVERQVLANLDHPNIARLIDGGSTPDGLPYLVMEFVEGRPIDQYCEAHRLTVTERLTLFRAVCAAVHYAHQNLIIHRDIKPSNILVTRDGVPKLLDFGIAKLLRPDLSTLSTMPTMPHLRPMTLFYASPEQAKGDSVTTSTDVYSLGVLLYKLLTAKLPYRVPENSPAAIHKAICEMEAEKPSHAIFREDDPSDTEPIPAATQKLESVAAPLREKDRSKLRRKLRGDLDVILLKALRKEPGRRYTSVEQFSEDIGRYLAGQPVIARKDTFGYRAAKFLARHAAAVVAGTIAVLALLAASIASFYSVRAVRQERERAERQLIDADLRMGDLERGLGQVDEAKKSYERALAAA
ncbi:MAG: serine/threonine protein kinase, partial [Bryobacteraceae bacterium]